MAATTKHRIQIKVIDVATGEEQISGEMVVLPGYCCSWCCCTVHGCIMSAAPQVGQAAR
jgi:hypothetical protein